MNSWLKGVYAKATVFSIIARGFTHALTYGPKMVGATVAHRASAFVCVYPPSTVIPAL